MSRQPDSQDIRSPLARPVPAAVRLQGGRTLGHPCRQLLLASLVGLCLACSRTHEGPRDQSAGNQPLGGAPVIGGRGTDASPGAAFDVSGAAGSSAGRAQAADAPVAVGGRSGSTTAGDAGARSVADDAPAATVASCKIEAGTVHIQRGASCALSETDKAAHGLAFGDTLSCSADGTVTFGGLSAGGGLELNGVKIVCDPQ